MSEKLASDESEPRVIVPSGRFQSTHTKTIKRTASHEEK